MGKPRLGKLTPERPPAEACMTCERREIGCHGTCAEYALETIVGVCAQTDARRRRRLEVDLAQFEPTKTIQRGRRYR